MFAVVMAMTTPAHAGLFLLADASVSVAAEAAAHHPYEAVGTWTAYTLGGAVLAAGLSTLLKKEPDRGRLLLGRSLGSLVGGVLGSRLAAVMYPSIWNWCYDPLLLVAMAIGFGLLGYATSYPVVNLMDRLGPRLLRGWLRSILGAKDLGDDDNPSPPTTPAKSVTTPTP